MPSSHAVALFTVYVYILAWLFLISSSGRCLGNRQHLTYCARCTYKHLISKLQNVRLRQRLTGTDTVMPCSWVFCGGSFTSFTLSAFYFNSLVKLCVPFLFPPRAALDSEMKTGLFSVRVVLKGNGLKKMFTNLFKVWVIDTHKASTTVMYEDMSSSWAQHSIPSLHK